MDMQHDFRPDPATCADRAPPSRPWLPEAYAIAAIVLALWVELAIHLFAA